MKHQPWGKLEPGVSHGFHRRVKKNCRHIQPPLATHARSLMFAAEYFWLRPLKLTVNSTWIRTCTIVRQAVVMVLWKDARGGGGVGSVIHRPGTT